MSTRWLIFSLTALLLPKPVGAQEDTLSDKRQMTKRELRQEIRQARRTPRDTVITLHGVTENELRVYKRWEKLIPTQSIIQFAGNMGIVSVGSGWNYGKHKQWETHLLFGFIPKYDSSRAKLTMTLKENYMPWRTRINSKFTLEPLACGTYVNIVFGHEFWKRQPNRYPNHYYDYMSTKIRFNAFLGQRLTMDVPRNRHKLLKSVTLFYEVSSCDLYIRAKVLDREVSWADILGLSIGLKLQML